MKYSFLLVALVSALGLAACGKSTSAVAPYTGPNKAAYDAAVEKCQKEPFDGRQKCVNDIMATVDKK